MRREPTLHEALAAHGYSTRPSDQHGVRIVVDASGAVVFRGRAREAWAWLREGRPRTSPACDETAHYRGY